MATKEPNSHFIISMQCLDHDGTNIYNNRTSILFILAHMQNRTCKQIDQIHFAFFTLLITMVIMFGFGCQGKNTEVGNLLGTTLSEHGDSHTSEDEQIKTHLHDELQAIAKTRPQEVVLVGVSLSNYSDSNFVDMLCEQSGVDVKAVVYYVPEIIGGIAHLETKRTAPCSTLLLSQIKAAIPTFVREQLSIDPEKIERAQIRVDGVFLSGTAEHLLEVWRDTPLVRAMQLSSANYSAYLPGPNQPLTNFHVK